MGQLVPDVAVPPNTDKKSQKASSPMREALGPAPCRLLCPSSDE